MSDEPFQVLGSADATFVVVNQIKEHYLAASGLLAGGLDRPNFRFWISGQVLDACSKAIENTTDRLRREKNIARQNKEKMGKFRLRVCREAGLGIGTKALTHLKTLTDHWNAHKHSGDGEAWKENMNLRSPTFTIDSFNLTTAIVAGYHRLVDKPEGPEWLRRAEIRLGEIVLSPVTSAQIDELLTRWGITADVKETS